MYFEIIGEIEDVEAIAIGRSIRDIARLRKRYGSGSLAKTEGKGDRSSEKWLERQAEIHWYEAHGIGKVKFKIEQFLD